MSKQPVANNYNTSKLLRNNGVSKEVILELPNAHPKQHEFITTFDRELKTRFIVGACGTKWGKLVSTLSPLPTTKGWVLLKDLREGDYLFDADGNPTLVEYITDVVTPEICYRVTFSDGNFIEACSEHLWETQTHACRKNLARVKSPKDRCKSTTFKPEVVTTQQIKDTLFVWDGKKFRPNHSIDNCGPVQFPEQDLLIDPYVLGAWLGDGSKGTNYITCDDKEQGVIDEIRNLGFEVTQSNFALQNFSIKNLVSSLSILNVLHNKHIPAQYLIGSVEQRLALLQGLMDTDGTIYKLGHCCFDNTNKNLADGVQELCETLGIKVTREGRWGKLNGVQKKWCYRVRFTTDLPVFRLQRKLGRIKKTALKTKRRYIVSIEQIESIPMQCIRVANERHLFLVGKFCVPTHNTYGCSIAIVKEAWNNLDYFRKPLPGPGLYWWVAPSYAQAKNAYELIKCLLPKDTFEEFKSDLRLTLLKPDGTTRSTIEFKSGDNPDTLRGFAVNFVIIDEAARILEASWVSVLTTLTQTQGRAIIISTPKGRGWFYDKYQNGEKFFSDGTPKYKKDVKPEDGGDPWYEWKSIRMQTWANPHVSLESIREARRNLPAEVFQQEYGAEFLQESAGVFRNIGKCFVGNVQPPRGGEHYVVGCDLAKLRDYTVLTVMNKRTLEVVYWDRFHQIQWEVQYSRIMEVARAYNNATVCLDSTGLGDPILETLQSGGLHVEGYKIGGSTAKQQLIDKLRLNIENTKLVIPKTLSILRRELENYEYEISEKGVVSFSAPRGQHDDAVISLALANWCSDRPLWKYEYSQIRGI